MSERLFDSPAPLAGQLGLETEAPTVAGSFAVERPRLTGPRIIVTVVRQHPDGYWTANASVDGATRSFHNRFGSWQTDRRPRADADWPAGVEQREAAPAVAAALERHLPRWARGRR
jgi:hypothetical protein